jgi:hypothetical protein
VLLKITRIGISNAGRCGVKQQIVCILCATDSAFWLFGLCKWLISEFIIGCLGRLQPFIRSACYQQNTIHIIKSLLEEQVRQIFGSMHPSDMLLKVVESWPDLIANLGILTKAPVTFGESKYGYGYIPFSFCLKTTF